MNSVEGKKKGETNINTSNTNKETNKEDLFSQVGKLTVHNENRVYNTDQIKKFVPYQKVAQAKARAISRQEKKLEEMQIKSVENLLNQIQMCQRYRKKLEYNIENDPAIAYQKDLLNSEYNLSEQKTQQKIDKLKLEMLNVGTQYQQYKTKLDALKIQSDMDKSSKSKINLERDYLYKQNKKLLVFCEEQLAQMGQQMSVFNAEMENNRREYTQKLALLDAQKNEGRQQVEKCKEMEDIYILTAKLLVDEIKQKDEVEQNTITKGFSYIFGNGKTAHIKNAKKVKKVSCSRRIVEALRGLYHYLCKKLTGIKKEKVRTQGKRAIEKQLKSDFTQTTFITKIRSTPSL